MVIDQDEQAAGYRLLARKVRTSYMSQLDETGAKRIPVPPVEETEQIILNRLLDPDEGMPFEARAVLRTKLQLPAEGTPLPATTNAPPAGGTNAPAAPR